MPLARAPFPLKSRPRRVDGSEGEGPSMNFFTRKKRPVTQSVATTRPAPVERPAMAVPAKEIKAMPRGSTGTRPARPTVPGLTDSDLVSLYNVASTRSLSPGECLIPEGGATDGCYIVIEGSLELRATVNGAPLGLGVIGKGECFGPARRGPPGPGTVWVGGARGHDRTGARRLRLRVAPDGHPADAWPPGRIHGGAELRRARAPPRRPGQPRRRSRVTREGAHRRARTRRSPPRCCVRRCSRSRLCPSTPATSR